VLRRADHGRAGDPDDLAQGVENETDEATRARRADRQVGRPRPTGVEAWLGEHTYVAGADFIVADILMTTVLRLARHARLLGGYSRREVYRQRCEACPAWARAVEQYEARLGAEPGAVTRAAEPG
jgi:glutathione S-transferase